jgi:hypothetical protein
LSGRETLNPRVVTEFVELHGHVLPTLVIVQSLDLSTQLRLSKSFEPQEGRECVTLPLEHDYYSIACAVIDEHAPVSVAFWRRDRHGTTQIRVDEVKGMRGSISSRGE